MSIKEKKKWSGILYIIQINNSYDIWLNLKFNKSVIIENIHVFIKDKYKHFD
jgi:hypothetical protein